VALERQVVVFKLGEKEYAIDILEVQEIQRYIEPTEVPNAPSFVKGIINLRGEIIPIFDINERFGKPPVQIDEGTKIIIVMVGDRKAGFIVNDVHEVLRISTDMISQVPDTIGGRVREFLKGVIKYQDRLILWIDVEKLFSEEEKEALAQI
jgi:purine-binding chemotaxis protein CheW